MTRRLRTYSAITDPELQKHSGIRALSPGRLRELLVLQQIFPFRINNFLLDNLVDWNAPYTADPIQRMLFPCKEMLSSADYAALDEALNGPKEKLDLIVHSIRARMNPHPAGQTTLNVPSLADGSRLSGLQHQYPHTVLFFPRQAQTCHSYCTFCFRWPQFVGDPKLRIESTEIQPLLQYLKEHPEVSDLLVTGGDPLVMTADTLRSYIDPILKFAPTITSIRIGTKALSYWPFRFFEDGDSAELLKVFEDIIQSGRTLTIVAHVTHPREMENEYFKRAAQTLSHRGCNLKVQTPLIRGINDSAKTLSELWTLAHQNQIIPYYLYIARDTGAQHYFGVPLVEAFQLFNDAMKSTFGLAGTVRGPVMSTEFGKIQIVGITNIGGTSAMVLKVLQARRAEFSGTIHLAKLNPSALWLSDLTPLDGSARFPFQ